MGCGRSALSTAEYSQWQLQFNALQLRPSEVGRLYKIFRKMDVDGSGSISVVELLTHIDVNRTRFTERVFGIFDEDGSGEIDFREFVLALWNYCTLTKATLDMFSFDLYDRDSSGELSAREVKKMLKDIYGAEQDSNFHARNIKNELRLLERRGRPVDVEEFRVFAQTHQALLFPAFQVQLYLQQRVLGKRFWMKNAQRRIQLSKGKFVPIGKLLEMHVNQQLMAQTLGGDVYSGLGRAQSKKLVAQQQQEKSAKAAAESAKTAAISAKAAAKIAASSKNKSSKISAQNYAETAEAAEQQLSEVNAAAAASAVATAVGAVAGEQHTWVRRNVNTSNTDDDAAAAAVEEYGADLLQHAQNVKLDPGAKVVLGTTGSSWKRKQQMYIYDSAKLQSTGAASDSAQSSQQQSQLQIPYETLALLEEAMHQPTRVLVQQQQQSSKSTDVSTVQQQQSQQQLQHSQLEAAIASSNSNSSSFKRLNAQNLKSQSADSAAADRAAAFFATDISKSSASKQQQQQRGNRGGIAEDPPLHTTVATTTTTTTTTNSGKHNTSTKLSAASISSKFPTAAPTAANATSSSSWTRNFFDFPGITSNGTINNSSSSSGVGISSGGNEFSPGGSRRVQRLQPLDQQHEVALKKKPTAGSSRMPLKAASYDQYQQQQQKQSPVKVLPLTADSLKVQQQEAKPISIEERINKPATAAAAAVKSIFDDPVGAARAKAMGRAMQRAESTVVGSRGSSSKLSLDPAKMGNGVKPSRRRSIT